MQILSDKELHCRYPASARILCEANISQQLSISSLATPTISLSSKAIYVESNKKQKPSFHRGVQPAAASAINRNLAPVV